MKLYVEGGGDTSQLHSLCRQGFHQFLEKAGFKGRQPRIVACGGRQQAYDRFVTACRQSSHEIPMLLVDSEDFVSATSPWVHLVQHDDFSRPNEASDEQGHLMVVCMESWFLADKDELANYFGRGFNDKALPGHTDIESISKNDVYQSILKATSQCRTKAPYGKGEHSFAILGRISPHKVKTASPWAARFLKILDEMTTPTKKF
ncbi:MAG: DUF4276 family protein [Magnetococcales bacterium]|nr:DUF4276 family protein [Magnetococcales bacterium]NGZ25421.1 DUF4276 family protein [Magnetococcales bacterium]